jgi:hypothetical protein
MSTVTYHAAALELLGAEGRRERRPVPALEAWARANDVVLPAAYLEWAELGAGPLLEKYSAGSDFHFGAPEIKIADGRRGLLFERENQGNFDSVVLLDQGDDPPVLWGWLGKAPWVTCAARLSDTIYAQIFDWQFRMDLDDDDDGEDESRVSRWQRNPIKLHTDRCLGGLRERFREVVASQYVMYGEPYATYRFLPSAPSTLTRLTAMVHPYPNHLPEAHGRGRPRDARCAGWPRGRSPRRIPRRDRSVTAPFRSRRRF